MAKVYHISQEDNENLKAFLERVTEAFRQYTPMDPKSPGAKAMATLAFINQAAPDIKRKLQRVERSGEKGLRDLVIVAEKVFNGREGTEEQIRQENKWTKDR